jgi:hypothetical protein
MSHIFYSNIISSYELVKRVQCGANIAGLKQPNISEKF